MNKDIIRVHYEDRIGEHIAEAHSKVSGRKHLPLFLIDGKKYLLKPLSKSKPYVTPYFCYGEVFWSEIIQKYFLEETPVYRPAVCEGLEKVYDKYEDKGTLVPYLLGGKHEKEQIINLYDYFMAHPDCHAKIKDYVNFCGINYDYREIFKTEVLRENRSLAGKLAMHLLISILKMDINYHYENNMFYVNEGGEITDVVEMIDHEYSVCFFLPELKEVHDKYFRGLLKDLLKENGTSHKNAVFIKENFPDVTKEFLQKLSLLKKDLPDIKLPVDEKFINPYYPNRWEFYNSYEKKRREEAGIPEMEEKEWEKGYFTAEQIVEWGRHVIEEIDIVIKILEVVLS